MRDDMRYKSKSSPPPDVRLTGDMRHVPVRDPGCARLPKVKCPVRDGEYCLFSLVRITPVEMDYACPACGEVVKKDVLTTGGWKTLVLDRKHE